MSDLLGWKGVQGVKCDEKCTFLLLFFSWLWHGAGLRSVTTVLSSPLFLCWFIWKDRAPVLDRTVYRFLVVFDYITFSFQNVFTTCFESVHLLFFAWSVVTVLSLTITILITGWPVRTCVCELQDPVTLAWLWNFICFPTCSLPQATLIAVQKLWVVTKNLSRLEIYTEVVCNKSALFSRGTCSFGFSLTSFQFIIFSCIWIKQSSLWCFEKIFLSLSSKMPWKIVSWNVNGLRTIATPKEPLKTVLDRFEADVICFQETKITSEKFLSRLMTEEIFKEATPLDCAPNISLCSIVRPCSDHFEPPFSAIQFSFGCRWRQQYCCQMKSVKLHQCVWAASKFNNPTYSLGWCHGHMHCTVRWSNFDRRDPKIEIFLQSTKATPGGHLLRWKLTPENPPMYTMCMAAMAIVLPRTIVEDFQSFFPVQNFGPHFKNLYHARKWV